MARWFICWFFKWREHHTEAVLEWALFYEKTWSSKFVLVFYVSWQGQSCSTCSEWIWFQGRSASLSLLHSLILIHPWVLFETFYLRKHPDPAPVSPAHCLLTETPPLDHELHFVNFEQINGVLIRRMILGMDGVAGPSGLDVLSWKRMCSFFGREFEDLCESIASIARKLCRSYVE